MNRGFTKLEIILVGIILIFVICFFGKKFFGPTENAENKVTVEKTTSLTNCSRTTPYEKPVEFERSLSLFKQGYSTKYGSEADFILSFLNCLDIQYAATNEAEGYFIFDKEYSTPNRLLIYVDNSYKIKDDILTAFLLAHEITHAAQFINKSDSSVSCYDLEIQAFGTQLGFLGTLNQEEQDSLVGRIFTTNYLNNPPLAAVKNFTDFSGVAMSVCGKNNSECYTEKMDKQIENMVKSNPYYQKQCNL